MVEETGDGENYKEKKMENQKEEKEEEEEERNIYLIYSFCY